MFIAKYNGAGVKQWIRQLGTATHEYGWGIAVDNGDGVYVTGKTAGHLDGNTNAGYSDAFITKYTGTGDKLWTRQFGSSTNDESRAIAVNGSEAVYITGNTGGSMAGNSNAGDLDVFVAKYA